MTQQQGGQDEDAPSGVTDTGDGTGGSFGTGAGGAGKSGGGTTGGVSDTGDGTGGTLGTGTSGASKGGSAGDQDKSASDKLVEGMSEAGKHPDEPLKR
jgi:hypothetical protein